MFKKDNSKNKKNLTESDFIDNYINSLSKKEKQIKHKKRSPRFVKKRRAVFAVLSVVLAFLIAIPTLFYTEVLNFDKIKSAFSHTVVGSSSLPELSDISVSNDNNNSDNSDNNISPERPSKLFATSLTAGEDYEIGNSDEFAALIKQLYDKGFTTVFLNLNYSKDLITESEENKTFLKKACLAAHENSISVFGVINVTDMVSGDITSAENAETIQNNILNAVKTDCFDGLMLKGVERDNTFTSFKEYIAAGTLSGFENYNKNRLTAFLAETGNIVKTAKGSLLFGIICDSVYATGKTLDDGMDVTCNTELLKDKNADVINWMKNGLCDIVFVEAFTSTLSKDLPFKTVVNWWSNNAPANCDIGFVLSGKLSVEGKGDFSNPDQLTRQLMELKSLNRYVFCIDGYSALSKDTSGAADSAFKYISGNIADDYVLKELSFTSPSKKSFTTYENKISIIGASDPVFDLTLNGEKVERTEYGYFSLELSLKPGKNTFKFVHKGKEETFDITYRYVIIKDYSPSSNIILDGGSTLVVKVTARQSSKITSALNGKTITLQETDGEENSDFVTYMGGFVLPEGGNADKSIGKITFTGTNSGISESFTGGKITVRKKDIPSSSVQSVSSNISSAQSSSQSTSSTNSSSQTESAEQSAGPSQTSSNYIGVGNNLIAEVTKYEVETFDGDTVDDLSQPYNNYLPKGTVDYCSEGTVYDPSSGNTYRTLRYGKRVYVSKNGITTLRGTLPSSNKININSFKTSGSHTVLTLDVDWKAPFTLEYLPQKYKSSTGSNRGTITSATFQYIEITFCYASSLTGVLNKISESPVFSNAQIIKNTSNYTLRLYLKKTGCFYGYSAEYNSNGQLVFKFLNPKSAVRADNTYGGRLDGITIVVDAGHGGSDGGAVGSNKNYDEADRNLFLAKKVQSRLEAIGATVVMTRTSDTSMTSDTRILKVKNASPDLAVSIHRNSSTGANARGFSSYYFNPFTKAAADKIAETTKASGAYTKTGVNWHYFFLSRISDCPVVLTENGFMSNSADFNNMLSDSWNNTCADAIVKGIVNYFLEIK